MPKQSKTRLSSVRHAPLGQVMQEDEDRGKFARRRTHSGRTIETELSDDDGYINGNGGSGETLLDVKTSNRILKMSREQQLEEEMYNARQKQRAHVHEDNSEEENDDDDNNTNEDFNDDAADDDDNGMIVQHDAGYITVEGPGLTDEDEAAIAAICGKSGEQRKNLADLILEKIAEKEALVNGTEIMDQEGGVTEYEELGLPPKVIEVSCDLFFLFRIYIHHFKPIPFCKLGIHRYR